MLIRLGVLPLAITLIACGSIAGGPDDVTDAGGDDRDRDPGAEICSDGTCDRGEDCSNCPDDCGICQPGCSNGTCDGTEDCTSCPVDCGVCAVCDDETCHPDETCTSCPHDCGPCVPLPDDLLPTLQAFRADYPTPMSSAQQAELLNRVAFQHRTEGWGLLRKLGGSRCPAPQGVDVACDILVNEPSIWHFEVLIDPGGAGKPVWRDVGPCVLGPSSGCDIARFVEPIAP